MIKMMKNRSCSVCILCIGIISLAIFFVIQGQIFSKSNSSQKLLIKYQGIKGINLNINLTFITDGHLYIAASDNLLLCYKDFTSEEHHIISPKVSHFIYLDFPKNELYANAIDLFQYSSLIVEEPMIYYLWSNHGFMLDFLPSGERKVSIQPLLSRIEQFDHHHRNEPLVEFSFFDPEKMIPYTNGFFFNERKYATSSPSNPGLHFFDQSSKDWTSLVFSEDIGIQTITDFEISGNSMALLDHLSSSIYLFAIQKHPLELYYLEKIALPEDLHQPIGAALKLKYLEKEQTIVLYFPLGYTDYFFSYWIASTHHPRFIKQTLLNPRDGFFVKGKIKEEEGIYYCSIPLRDSHWKLNLEKIFVPAP